MTNNTPKRRGGARPGAGAPRGNLNALKHGGRSRQFASLGALLVTSPVVRDALFKLGQRHLTQRHKAEEVAAEILARLFSHARDIAAGKDSPRPLPGPRPVERSPQGFARRTINQKGRPPRPPQHKPAFAGKNTPHGQSSGRHKRRQTT